MGTVGSACGRKPYAAGGDGRADRGGGGGGAGRAPGAGGGRGGVAGRGGRDGGGRGGGPGPAAAGTDPRVVVAHPGQRGAGRAGRLGGRAADRGGPGAGGHGGGGGGRGARAAAAEGAARARRRRGDRAGPAREGVGVGRGGGWGGGFPGDVGAGVPRSAGEPAGRAGGAAGRAVRGAAGQPDPVRGHRLRAGARRRAGRDVPRRRGRRRHRGVPGRAGRAVVRPSRGGPAGARVLRAHHPVRAGHRAGVAAVGAPGVPALPDPAGPAARAGQRADEPARGPARGAQPDRHHLERGRWGDHGAGVDPLGRGHRGTHLRGHLHHLPAPGPGLRERGVPAAAGQLHGHAGAGAPAGRRADPGQPQRSGPARALPDLHRHLCQPGNRRADDGRGARVRRAARGVRDRRAGPGRALVLGVRLAVPGPALPDAPQGGLGTEGLVGG